MWVQFSNGNEFMFILKAFQIGERKVNQHPHQDADGVREANNISSQSTDEDDFWITPEEVYLRELFNMKKISF